MDRGGPFDYLRVRHHGITASAGLYFDLNQVGNLIIPFNFWNAWSSTAQAQVLPIHAGGTLIVDLRERPDDGNEFYPEDLAPALCAMPGCRASYGGQTIGVVPCESLCGKRSIETQTAPKSKVYVY